MRRRHAVLCLLLFVAACMPRHRPPASGARLSVGAETFQDDGPFRVAFAGPKGEGGSPREVSIAFSRPVIAAGVAGDGAPSPATVTRVHDGRRVDGAWRWFGGRTAIFWPTSTFEPATSFRVAVDPAVRALDGSALAAFEPFVFTSPRPALESASYEYEEDHDRHVVTLDFTQAMSSAGVKRAVRIEGRTAAGVVRSVDYSVRDRDPDTRVRLDVDRLVTSLASVVVVTAPSLTSEEGPLSSDREARVEVPGLGPLRAEIDCPRRGQGNEPIPRCELLNGPIELRFSKGVDTKDLARSLVVSSPKKRTRNEDPWRDAGGLTYSVDLDALMDLAPGRRYRVTVKAGVRAADKERLAADQVLELETLDHAESLSWRDIGRQAVVESARPAVTLHLETMNIASFEAIRAPLDEGRLFDLMLREKRSASWVRALPGSVADRTTIGAPRNAGAKARFDLPADMRARSTSNAFAVAAVAKGLDDDVRLLSVTDLGITSKWSPHGGLVWVTRLSTGAPVESATVSVRRAFRPASDDASVTSSEAYPTITGADGIATIPAQVAATFLEPNESGAEAILVVSDGDDRAYAHLPHLDPHLARATGSVFTERRLYRPGESVLVKGYFRAPSGQGLVTLAGRQASIEALDDEERILFASSVTLDAFGAFSAAIPIPRTARLGFASVRARVGGPPAHRDGLPLRRHRGWDPAWPAQARFTIDEFRTVEHKVWTAADRTAYTRGDTARLTVRGTYLFGARMQDVPVAIRASRSATTFTPPGFEGFATDDHALRRPRHSSPGFSTDVATLDVRLGADGKVTVPIPLALPEQVGPELVSFEGSIDDVSGAFAAADHTSAVVHPADIYLGVRIARDASLEVGKPVRVELAAGATDGTRRPGVDTRVELLEEAVHSGAPPVPTGRACQLRTTTTIASCDLAVTHAGTHWLRATALDSKGRAIAASTTFQAVKVAPPPPPPPPPPPAPAAPPAPPLTFEEACARPSSKNDYDSLVVEGGYDKTYEVGETARVCMRGAGRTLMTLEREGVLRHELRQLGDTGTVVSIPITAELYPNVYVVLRGVYGRTAPFPRGPQQADHGRPTSSSSSVEIRVTSREKKLTVDLETPGEARPGAEVETRVRVRDGKGRPATAQVTLWAVDEGVFLLEPFSTPDPLALFAGERRSDVVETDSRDDLLWEKVGMHSMRSPSLRQGATQVGPRDHLGRAIFRPTAWFMPSVVTGPDGAAVVKAKLPDNLTTWKVFAVAATTADGFGSAETSFHTNKPLMVRPALPRFMRTGDHVEATVVLDSLAKQPLDVKVSMVASGALKGAGGWALTIPPEGHVPVRFDVDAHAAGKGKIAFAVVAPREKLHDEVTIEEDVSLPSTLETVTISGETRARTAEPLGDLSLAHPGAGGFDFRLSTSPLVGLAESLGGLVEYPYGCTEQLTSRLVPLVRVRGMARDFGVALPRDVDGAVRSALASLLSHQRGDGGFGFWPQSRASEPWLTILAAGALHAARENGFTVPPSTIDRALAYLERANKDAGAGEESALALDAGERAMMEDLFAQMGHPREKELRALASDPGAPLFARALVAGALAKVDRDLGRRLLAELASHARVTGATATLQDESALVSRKHLSSTARTTAMAVRAFATLDPEHPLLTKLVRGLMSLRRDGRWSTTQESAWALIALDAVRPLYARAPGGSTARLSLDGEEVAKASFGGAARPESITGSLAMARLVGSAGATLSFTTEGGPLFYEGALRYARREPPRSPLEHGIHVAKTMRLLQRGGDPALVSRFRTGDYVEIDVVLASPVPRQLVVVDDPIPSGFEAVNQSYANADRQAFRPDASTIVTHRELRDDRVVTFFDELPSGVHHTSYVLRVISAGKFVTPPTKAECMYAPDVFGRTAASTVEARP